MKRKKKASEAVEEQMGCRESSEGRVITREQGRQKPDLVVITF